MQRRFNQTMTFLAVFLAASLGSVALAADSPTIDVGGQQLTGAWVITLSSDTAGAAPPQTTSGILSSAGTVFIQNTVPDMPGTKLIQGVGEWVRIGNRQFALTWVYIITNAADGTYVGMFQDKATLQYNSDLTQLSGDFSFEVTLADGSKPFSGTGKMKAARVAIVPL